MALRIRHDHVILDGNGYLSLPTAATAAELLLEKCIEPTTFAIVDENGRLMAAVTNRRIEGVFLKQEWGGHKGDTAIEHGEETFDATDAILLMDHEEVLALTDNSQNTDAVGKAHVQWDGPHDVHLADAISDYFGVELLDAITPEALAFAKARANPQEPIMETVTLSIRVKLRMAPGADVQEFIDNLDYSVKSKTTGMVVTEAEIIESEVTARPSLASAAVAGKRMCL